MDSTSGFRSYTLVHTHTHTRRASLRRLLFVFTSSNLRQIRFEIETPRGCDDALVAFDTALQDGKVVGIDVHPLRTIALLSSTDRDREKN